MITLALASLVLGQASFRYADGAKSFSLSAHSGKVTDLGAGKYRFQISGDVGAESKSQGLQLSAQSIDLIVAPGSDRKSTRIQTATTGGHLTVSKTTGQSALKVTGSGAQFQAGTEADTLSVSGPVKAVGSNAPGHQTLTGSSDRATFELVPGVQAKNPLRKATLIGHVVAHMMRASGSKDETYDAIGDRAVLDYTVSPATIELTGGVRIDAHGAGAFHMEGIARAIWTLNDKGEATGFEVKP